VSVKHGETRFPYSYRRSTEGSCLRSNKFVTVISPFGDKAEMQSHGCDWSEQVSQIHATTLLVFADGDSIRPEHIVAFYKALGGGQRDAGLDGSLHSTARLGIVPGATYYNILSTTAVANIASAFLA